MQACDIFQEIVEAIEDDTTRDGACIDLPIGPASEIVNSKALPLRDVDEMKIVLRCHCEIAND